MLIFIKMRNLKIFNLLYKPVTDLDPNEEGEAQLKIDSVMVNMFSEEEDELHVILKERYELQAYEILMN